MRPQRGGPAPVRPGVLTFFFVVAERAVASSLRYRSARARATVTTVQFFNRARYLATDEFHVAGKLVRQRDPFYDAFHRRTPRRLANPGLQPAGSRPRAKLSLSLRVSPGMKFMKPIASRVPRSRKFMFRDAGLCGEIDR